MKTTVTTRDAGDVKIIELHGKITIGAGDLQMREAIHTAISGGAKKLLVDMKDVTTIDSSGVGELVGCYTTATHKGAKLKLVNLPPEDQRRPHRDPAHHRVRRLHEREGRARELLMGSGRRGAVLRPIERRGRASCALRSFAPARRGARRRRRAPPGPPRGGGAAEGSARSAPVRGPRRAPLAGEARAAGARRPRGRAVRRAPRRASSTRAPRSKWCTRPLSSSTTCRRWTTRRLGAAARPCTSPTARAIAILAAVTLLVRAFGRIAEAGLHPRRGGLPSSAALDLVSRLADASGLARPRVGPGAGPRDGRGLRHVRPPRDDPRAQDGRALRRVGGVRRRRSAARARRSSRRVRSYARNVGLAFQIVDDLLEQAPARRDRQELAPRAGADVRAPRRRGRRPRARRRADAARPRLPRAVREEGGPAARVRGDAEGPEEMSAAGSGSDCRISSKVSGAAAAGFASTPPAALRSLTLLRNPNPPLR